jgi:hypothetical protein
MLQLVRSEKYPRNLSEGYRTVNILIYEDFLEERKVSWENMSWEYYILTNYKSLKFWREKKMLLFLKNRFFFFLFLKNDRRCMLKCASFNAGLQ